jgi:hypothetical protein
MAEPIGQLSAGEDLDPLVAVLVRAGTFINLGQPTGREIEIDLLERG